MNAQMELHLHNVNTWHENSVIDKNGSPSLLFRASLFGPSPCALHVGHDSYACGGLRELPGSCDDDGPKSDNNRRFAADQETSGGLNQSAGFCLFFEAPPAAGFR